MLLKAHCHLNVFGFTAIIMFLVAIKNSRNKNQELSETKTENTLCFIVQEQLLNAIKDIIGQQLTRPRITGEI